MLVIVGEKGQENAMKRIGVIIISMLIAISIGTPTFALSLERKAIGKDKVINKKKAFTPRGYYESGGKAQYLVPREQIRKTPPAKKKKEIYRKSLKTLK